MLSEALYPGDRKFVPVQAVSAFPLPASAKINDVSRHVIYASSGHEIASKSFDLSAGLNHISRFGYSKIVTFPGPSFLNFTLDSFKWAPRWNSKSY